MVSIFGGGEKYPPCRHLDRHIADYQRFPRPDDWCWINTRGWNSIQVDLLVLAGWTPRRNPNRFLDLRTYAMGPTLGPILNR